MRDLVPTGTVGGAALRALAADGSAAWVGASQFGLGAMPDTIDRAALGLPTWDDEDEPTQAPPPALVTPRRGGWRVAVLGLVAVSLLALALGVWRFGGAPVEPSVSLSEVAQARFDDAQAALLLDDEVSLESASAALDHAIELAPGDETLRGWRALATALLAASLADERAGLAGDRQPRREVLTDRIGRLGEEVRRLAGEPQQARGRALGALALIDAIDERDASAQALVERLSDDAWSLLVRAMVLARAGSPRTDEAQALVESALELEPRLLRARFELAALTFSSDSARAGELLASIREASPRHEAAARLSSAVERSSRRLEAMVSP